MIIVYLAGLFRSVGVDAVGTSDSGPVSRRRSRSTSCARDTSWAARYRVSNESILIQQTALTVPQVCIDTFVLEQFGVRSALSNMPVLEHQDLVAIVDGTQPVRDKHTGACLFFDYAVDILQKRLFRICIQGRGLEVWSISIHPAYPNALCTTHRFIKEK